MRTGAYTGPDAVYAMVSEFTGIRLEKITPQSRLNYEVGLDGDDAVEFFEKYAERFGVEMQDLHTHWSEHFGPEGTPLATSAALCVPPIIVGVVLNRLIHAVPVWGLVVACCILWWLLVWLWGRIRTTGKPTPIMVEDLVQSVVAKKWVKEYDRIPPQ